MVLSHSQLDVPIFEVQCQDGTGGHVFLLVPITTEERTFLAEHGWPALFEHLREADPSDTSRPSVV
jgi:hypothetical protein